ncbi:MAG: sigma-54-dependent Fis family transcriptional regulator [Deltaproteobacteria bacterium]|nr:sigma-54-dependent Fis family transcriptional regulator [Deltaproteobacteria bacterium]
MKPILVVDDDPQMRSALKEAIQRIGFGADACENGQEAIGRISRSGYSLVVTDMKMPGMDGLSLLREIRRRSASQPVLVITGYGTVENAVETMREGATDYLLKPFSFDALKKAVLSVMARASHEREMHTADPGMRKVLAVAGNIAASDITVLIHGESGTGKELLARYIHHTGRRAERPFVAVNCAAIPETLMESELFGHEKGAFTGAAERKKGKIEQANGGTILLDEIGEMPILLQAKLLRVLQEKEVDRVGGKEPVPVDVRVIATTNRDLQRECREGRFREDLYYRLNVFPVKLPPLRERPDDIPLLAAHFAEKFSAAEAKKIVGFTEEGLAVLRSRPWRGNIRELQNVIRRAVLICSGDRIGVNALMFDEPEETGGFNGRIRDMEKEMILRTLKEVDGNKARAAELLGVTVRTIRNKLNEYGH